MKFSDIVGHEEGKATLRKMADTGKIPHAILFSGQSGIGKFRLARAFAQYVHCKNPQNGDSCGKCPSCLQHQSLNNPDLHFVYPIVKKDGAIISKDVIDIWKEFITANSYMQPERWNDSLNAGNSQPVIYVNESEEIISKATLSAYQENFKIFLIWLPEKLRVEAANKLLKIIEEPFEDTLFLLVSNDDSKIIPTIYSRTFLLNLKPLALDDIVGFLNKSAGDNPVLSGEAARLAEGSLAKAEEVAKFPDEMILFADTFMDIMRMAYAVKLKNLKQNADNIASWGREKIIRFLNYTARMIRENYILNLSNPDLSLMTNKEREFSIKFSPFIHDANVESMLYEISRAASDIERNGNAKIVLFDMMLFITRLIKMPKTQHLPFIYEN